MPNENPPSLSSVIKLRTSKDDTEEILETLQEIEVCLYDLLNSMLDLGVDHHTLIGMLEDIKLTYREAMYEE